MSDLFSEEMKKELIKLIDSRIPNSELSKTLDTHKDVYLGIEKALKGLNVKIVDNEESISTLENEIEELVSKVKESVKGEDLEDAVNKTMLILMPEFNKKISREIKKHLVALAEHVIKNFKEKE